MTRCFQTVAGLMGTSALALTLSACKLENRPLFGPEQARAPYDAAPPVGPLDPGAAPPVQAYAYPERAYTVSRAAYQRPPDYAFAYEDERPWAWAADDGLMFAEPYGDDWRYYYYEPGEDYPYYVQDADYGYAYGDDGVLLALFTAAGALIAADRYDDYAPRAGYYWTRAHDLNRSYYRAPRYRIEETVWRERAPVVFASHDRWYRAFERQPGWREAARHDNGRHLGWYKDRDDRRSVAAAAPPQPVRPIDERKDRGWDKGREARHARVEHRPQNQDRPNAIREAQRDHGPPRAVREAQAQAQAQAQAHENRSGASRQARQEHGPQHQARDADAHGRDSGWKGQDRPQPQEGGGDDRGGGGKERGRGGGQDKGDGHDGKGGK